MTNNYLDVVTKAFPNVRPIACDTWSDLSNIYNCIAWAAEDTQKWWWPVGGTSVPGGRFKPSYWPAGALREVTIPAFVQAFQTLGYVICIGAGCETGFTKVALYAKAAQTRKPTHMARQLPNGIWTSKLGTGPDIFHENLECLEGGKYGTVATILRRPIS